MIVNIGRQLAAGGREIGKILAEKLNLEYCDREIIFAAAQQSGIAPEQFERADEIQNRLLYALGKDNHIKLFQLQSETIRDLADKHDCLFLGRCADYILRDRNDCINIFLSANEQDRIKRLLTSRVPINNHAHDSQPLSETEALELIHKTDEQRAEYYNFFTNKTWGAAASYDLCINTSVLGIQQTVELILQFINSKQK